MRCGASDEKPGARLDLGVKREHLVLLKD